MRQFSSSLQVIKMPLLCYQLFVRSLLYYATSVEHMNSSWVVYRLYSVSYHQTCLPSHHLVQLLLHHSLSLSVQSWCGFIQHQNLRISYYNPCNRYSLLLTSRQLTSSHSHIASKTFFFFLDKFSSWSKISSSLDFSITNLSIIPYVWANTSQEKTRFLTNPSEMLSDMMKIIISQLNSINNNISFIVIKPLQKLEKSRFTTTRRSHKCNLLSFPDVEINSPQNDVISRIILKIKIPNLNISLNSRILQFRSKSNLPLILIFFIQNHKQIPSRLLPRQHIRHEIKCISSVPSSPRNSHNRIKYIQLTHIRIITHNQCTEIE